MLALDIHALEAGYDGRPVLRDVSFGIEAGCFLGIIGPNGAGKSTLMKTLSRVLTPTSGTIALLGRPLQRYTPRELARCMACVPQFQAQPFSFPVEEFVLMGRYPHSGRFSGLGRRDRRACEQAMDLLEVSPLRRARLGELSGGEMQRVFIAQALAQEPTVLLLDEPTAHLDIAHQVKILDRLRSYGRHQRLTVVVILHDLNLTGLYCEHVVLMKEGRVCGEGAPEAVITAETIQSVYATQVIVQQDPVAARPHVYIVPGDLPD